MKKKPYRKCKIDKALLQKALADGKMPKQIADEMGVTRAAVCKAIKRLPPETAGHVVRNDQKIEQIVDSNISVMEQFGIINDAAHKILESTRDKRGIYSHKTTLECCRVIKDQLEFYAKIISMLHDFETVQRFKTEVLEAIGEVAPDVREKIIQRLRDKRSVGWALDPTGSSF